MHICKRIPACLKNSVFQTGGSVILLGLLLALPLPQAYADRSAKVKKWYMDTGLSAKGGSYKASQLRDNLYAGSLWLNAEYLDTFAMAVAYTGTTVNLRELGGGQFSLKQNAVAARLQYHQFSDSLRGKISYQLVTHVLDNNEPVSARDSVTVLAPKIAYSNYAKTLTLGLEYTWSRYGDGELIMQQLMPAFGFGFNKRADFIRLRAYLIRSSNSRLSQGEDSLSAAALRWTHRFGPGGFIGIDSFFLDVLGGRRIFAVDNDTLTVYNLADVQQGSASLGLGWRPGENVDINVVGGLEKYQNRLISNDYDQPYIHVSLTMHW